MKLFDAAFQALMTCDPGGKCTAAQALWQGWRKGDLMVEDEAPPPIEVPVPGRPMRPMLVPPQQVQQRGLGTPRGRAALIHALAHIEFNAINLALDAVYRFRGLPDPFYGDWLRVAAEEAYHFGLLREHLLTLGAEYGDFPAHNGLWDMAVKTAHDPLVRMALVPRLLEARGLDVTPGIQAKLVAGGDLKAARILDVILRDEVGHVAIGNRWFAYLCAQRGLPPAETFTRLLARYAAQPKPPFNRVARSAAGFEAAELDWLEKCGSFTLR